MKTIIIPYNENKDKSILFALNALYDFSDIEFEYVGVLKDKFHSKNDISCEISIEKLDALTERLEGIGFTYKII